MKSRLVLSRSVAAICIFLPSCRSGSSFPPGGHPYPKQIIDSDMTSYIYPLKDSLSKLDSFNHIWDGMLFQDFDEPNLSLRPLKTTEFRLFQPGFRQYDGLIISLTPTMITVKRQSAWHHRFTTDTNKLSPLERRLIEFMGRNYGKPRPDSIRWPLWYHYIDSMEILYPQLRDPAWYLKTVKKEMIHDTAFKPCGSITREITSNEYQLFVDSLNASGYWNMPYERECHEGLAIDGPYYFSLEANTPNQYNFVIGNPCPNDTNLFYKACQHLARLAGLEKEINVLWIEGPPDTTSHKKVQVIDDVILEDVKPAPKKHHPKKPHPN